MKIDSSVIGMESARTFESTTTRKLSYRVRRESTAAEGAAQENTNTEGSLENTKEETKSSLKDIQDSFFGTGRLFYLNQTNAQEELAESVKRIQEESIVYLWRLLFGDREGKELSERLGMDRIQGPNPSLVPASVSRTELNQSPGLEIVAKEEICYTEKESTSFSTTGTVRTADGREFTFNLEVGMSRSFSRYVSKESILKPKMCDPLVINLEGNVARVSDQKFFFDLDADGKEEEISRLQEDGGYLALDLNGDGRINDGSELFGTRSGDGFADLAKYDEDGNGWIDENDTVWNKLQIWIQEEDGSSGLYRLAEKGVGAICLKNASTNFTQRGGNGEVNAAIRSTGIFLYESGLAGTIQHLDLAVNHLTAMA